MLCPRPVTCTDEKRSPASVIVVWRFTGSRMVSETSERRAQRAVAVSFWQLDPYIAIQAIRDLAAHHPASPTPWVRRA